MTRKPLTDKDGEVRQLLAEDIRIMRPAAEVLPADLVAVLPKRRPGQRGPGKRPPKQPVTLRVKPEVLDAYRATGKGWQTRMVEAIERAIVDSAPAVKAANDSFPEVRKIDALGRNPS
jgi:uncharacterized protein (DUF4415 family)